VTRESQKGNQKRAGVKKDRPKDGKGHPEAGLDRFTVYSVENVKRVYLWNKI